MSEEMKMDAERAAFEREDRYLVIKYSDLNKVSPEYRLPFKEYLDHVLAEVPRREFVVVESDWPEYEKVWQMIEARMTGASLPVGVPDASELQRVIYSADAAAKRMLDADSFWWSEIATIRVEFERFMRAMLAAAPAAPTGKAEHWKCEQCGASSGEACNDNGCFANERSAEEAPSLPAAGSAYGISLPSVAEFGEWVGQEDNGLDSATRGMLLALFKWTLDRVCALNANRAALSAQQSAQPEFCCKHSHKAAKQAAWAARDLTHCNCDHHEHCEHCWPDDFKEGGKWHNGFETQQSAPERVSVPVDGVEAPEVVAWMWRDLNGDMQFNYMHPEGQELMTVSQHNRIVAQLVGGDSVSVPRELCAAATDVLAERQRQITAEGWTPERDNAYVAGELNRAAACYASWAHYSPAWSGQVPEGWPWNRAWWKPSTPRRNLIKAGALILAEIERLDRALLSRNGNGGV